jgi:hypothetical protein
MRDSNPWLEQIIQIIEIISDGIYGVFRITEKMSE